MLFEKNELDVELLRSRFSELQALCDKLEALRGGSEDSKHEIQLTLLHLEEQFRKIDANMRHSKVGATFSRLRITPEDLYILSFGDRRALLKEAHSGNRDSSARLITTIRSSISFWEERVFSELGETYGNSSIMTQELVRNPPGGHTSVTNVEIKNRLAETLQAEFSPGIRWPDIVLILGAGASSPLGLPTMKEFWNVIKTEAENGRYDARDVLRKIEEAHNLEHVGGPPDLEQLLFLLERYKLYYDIMFDDPVFGFDQTQVWNYRLGPYSGKTFRKYIEKHLQYDAWYSTGLKRLKDYLESLIIQAYWPRFESGKDKDRIVSLFSPLISLILDEFGQPFLPVFTTNYDPVIESYCEFSGTSVEYGFERVGARHRWNRSRFTNYAPVPDKQNIVLFKLHGSLSWRREGDNIFDYALSLERGPGEFAVIYPTQTKEYPYEEPFKTAYRYLEDYLKRAKIAIVIGYSFRDRGIGYVIREVQDLNKRLKFLIICGQNHAPIDSTKFAANSCFFIPASFKAGQNAPYLTLLQAKLQNILA